MSSLFPEQPILFYPSLACRFGPEPAILLAVYHQYARHHGGLDAQGAAQFVIRRREWLELTPYWDEEKLAQLTSTLVDQGVLEAQFLANGSIQLAVLNSFDEVGTASEAAVAASIQPSPIETEATARLESVAPRASLTQAAVPQPSASQPLIPRSPLPSAAARATLSSQSQSQSQSQSPATVSEPVRQSAGYGHVARGPAPSFGGSTGWARPQDPLERLFEQQEQHNRQLKEIDPKWKPQPTTLQMLAKQSISDAFALDCVDQFVAYYMGQGQRKKSWEQPFMKWAKREFVDAQNKQNRQQASSNYPTNNHQGYNGERDQTRTRQDKRERITNAVMDIQNTDW